MPILLGLALAVVYLLGLGGIVLADSYLGEHEIPTDLEARLAAVRRNPDARAKAIEAIQAEVELAAKPVDYFVRAEEVDASRL